MKRKIYYIIMLGLIIYLNCSSVKQNVKPSEENIEKKLVYNYYTKQDKLSYNGYEVIKLKKNEQSKDGEVELSYAVLKRNEQVLMKFDEIYHPLGNAIEFGLFPLLNNGNKQLLVSNAVPVQGRHWVVDLSNTPQILFDSFDYNVNREDCYLTDIDGDGIKELILELTVFWGFNRMSMAQSPLTEIIFKYDKNSNKYIPANHIFQKYSSKILEDELKIFNSSGEKDSFPNIFRVFLLFLYSGQEQQAWAFFDKNYVDSDR